MRKCDDGLKIWDVMRRNTSKQVQWMAAVSDSKRRDQKSENDKVAVGSHGVTQALWGCRLQTTLGVRRENMSGVGSQRGIAATSVHCNCQGEISQTLG